MSPPKACVLPSVPNAPLKTNKGGRHGDTQGQAPSSRTDFGHRPGDYGLSRQVCPGMPTRSCLGVPARLLPGVTVPLLPAPQGAGLAPAYIPVSAQVPPARGGSGPLPVPSPLSFGFPQRTCRCGFRFFMSISPALKPAFKAFSPLRISGSLNSGAQAVSAECRMNHIAVRVQGDGPPARHSDSAPHPLGAGTH